jgi:hypothetical protein
VFLKLDGVLPRPSDWVDGPGGIKPDARPWAVVGRDYEFVDELGALQGRIRGAGNLERYRYWRSNFEYLRAMAQLNCLWGEFNQALVRIRQENDPERRRALARETALPLRIRMIQTLARIYEHLLGTLTNTSELGTVANWEQHLLPEVLQKPGGELARELGEPLPPEAQPHQAYSGPLRIVVPAARPTLATNEKGWLRAIVLAERPPRQVTLHWRPMGSGAYRQVKFSHEYRGCFTVALPDARATGGDFEYYITALPTRGAAVYWPATAPKINQTVVLLPQLSASFDTPSPGTAR